MINAKFTTLCLLFFLANYALAQQLTPQTFSNAGNSSANGNILLESSIGGLVVAPVNSNSFMYTPGFLQPYAGVTNNIPVINNITLKSGAGIDNAGTTFTKNNAMIEFTVGEFASATFSKNTSMLTQGILQPMNIITGPLPVTNLQFSAKRMNQHSVQLLWQTEQEFNNKGFYIEKRKENEQHFAMIGFEPSKATGGNSYSPLYYEQTDQNSFAGKTYYRLKQEDLDGKATYSAIRIVTGNGEKLLLMKAWPVPAINNVNISVQGILKPDMIQVFDINGRLVRSIPVTNQLTVNVTGLTPGTYVVRLASDGNVSQKILIQ
jgi:hypothetical protein